jgi:hypothetical protein
VKAAHYHAVAKEYAAIWTTQTAGGLLGGHVSSYGANGTFSLKYNLVFDRVLGTNLFTKPIQTECSVFRTLQRIYHLNNGLPFGGDAGALSLSLSLSLSRSLSDCLCRCSLSQYIKCHRRIQPS